MSVCNARYSAALISCDIVGHSSAPLDRQRQRVSELNELVRSVIDHHGPDAVLWASGGDGGHVVFSASDWQRPAIAFARRLRRWAIDAHTPLRLAGHYGTITSIVGADGRNQPVGDAINTAGRILALTSASGMAVSTDFRRQFEDPQAVGVEFHSERTLPTKGGGRIELCLMSIGGSVPRSTWGPPEEVDGALLDLARRRAGIGEAIAGPGVAGVLLELESRIAALRAGGAADVADAIEHIGRAVAHAPDLTDRQRAQLLHNLDDIAAHAASERLPLRAREVDPGLVDLLRDLDGERGEAVDGSPARSA